MLQPSAVVILFMKIEPSLIAILTLTCSVVGCSTTESTRETLSHPSAASENALETYIGGQIFKVERMKPLPNAFGKSDIFGRKVYAGYTELRYQGLTDDGKLMLQMTEVETHSTETTMSRSGQGYVQGTVNKQGDFNGTVTEPPKGSTELLPPNTTQFLIDPNKERELSIAGVKVRFLDYTRQTLRYSLEKPQK